MDIYARAIDAEYLLKWTIRDAGEALRNQVEMLLSGDCRGENIEKYVAQIRKAQSSLYTLGFLRDNLSLRFGLKGYDLKRDEQRLSAYIDDILNPIL